MGSAALSLPVLQLSEVETQASLDTQEVQLREQMKALAQVEQQLKDFAEAYKLIKTERNHTHSHIQKLQQVWYSMYAWCHCSKECMSAFSLHVR